MPKVIDRDRAGFGLKNMDLQRSLDEQTISR